MFEDEIRSLAARKHSAEPFLSLYLDARGDESQRDRLRLFLKDEMRHVRDAVGGNARAAELEKGIKRIERYFDEPLDGGTRGVAIFSCPAEDFFVPLQLPMSVAPSLTIAGRPQLRPLVLLRQSFPPVTLAMVDAKFARLFELDMGRILHEIDLEQPDLPRRHDQGGWSQSNLQRHVQDHIDRHHKEVAELLTRMADSGRLSAIILAGQERNIANFRGFLSRRVDERILGTTHLDHYATGQEVVAECQRVIASHRTATIGERLVSVVSAAEKQGRAALGFDAVVDAANQRKLDRLYIRVDAECRGWRCISCNTLGRVVPLGCPACGSGVTSVELVEELIAAASSESGSVEIVDGPSDLDRYEGIGAALRF